jgi:hypothetical protein
MQPRKLETAFRSPHAWYALYHAAMLESDKRSALFQIECAQNAMLARAAELRTSRASDRQELEDLSNAIEHLRLLLQDFNDDFADTVWN